jgi:hypothetical protein
MGTKRPDQYHRDLGEPGADSDDRGPDPAIHEEARHQVANQREEEKETGRIPESTENPAQQDERERKRTRDT